MPASHNYHLHEERLAKTPLGLTNNELNIQRALATPINILVITLQNRKTLVYIFYVSGTFPDSN
jgi:hypothetical protein